jgi:small subunit ribosomal protein S20
MPQHKSAEKRVRQTVRRTARNKAKITKMRTLVKKLRTAKTKEEAKKMLGPVVKYLDQIASKGVIHKNKAANLSSSLTKHVSAMK